MTLRQTIQAAPTKTNELISKLANTSNQAIKTRESLFEEVTAELSQYVEIEDSQLLPLLRKHPQTKDLAVSALKGNKDLRAQLALLQAMPKDNDAFLEKVTELKKGFQAHVRGERNELLPAILKALNDEEASQLAENLDAAVADAEKGKRYAKRQEAAESKLETEAAKQIEAAKRAAVRAEKAAGQAARKGIEQAVDSVKRGGAALQDGARRASASVAREAEHAAASVRDAVGTYRDTSQDALADVRAMTASTTSAVKVASEIGSAWLGLARKVIGLNRETSRRLINCRSIGQLAEVQRSYVSGSMRSLMEGGTEVLQIAQRASKQALNPLQNRLDKAA